MSRISREEMVAEFGEPGVENPMMLDLVTTDPVSGRVVLAMIERRPWGAAKAQLAQIEEKINRYLGYVLDGFLAEQYPQYEGRRVQLRLVCAAPPDGEAARFCAAAEHACGEHGIGFEVVVQPPQAPQPAG